MKTSEMMKKEARVMLTTVGGLDAIKEVCDELISENSSELKMSEGYLQMEIGALRVCTDILAKKLGMTEEEINGYVKS